MSAKKAPVEPVDREALELRLASTELGFEVAIAETLEGRGVYDLTRLEARHPLIYRAACKCIQTGVSAGMVADLLGLDIRTVNMVVHRLEAENAITPYKERTVHQLRAVVTLAIDQLIDRARSGALGALDVAILIDKIELLSGGVTSRSEVRVSDEERQSFDYFRRARADLGLPMDLEAEILPQRAALLPAPGEREVGTVERVPVREAGD